MSVVLTATTGMLSGVAAATGEEMGWRGFLVPELAKGLTFTFVAVAIGFAQAWLRLKTARPSLWITSA